MNNRVSKKIVNTAIKIAFLLLCLNNSVIANTIQNHNDRNQNTVLARANSQKHIATKKNLSFNYKKSINNVRQIFEDYKTNSEGCESKSNMLIMTKSLKSLTKVTDLKDLTLLLNVWMYYDPADYPTRQLVFNVLKQDKEVSIKAVKYRLKHKLKWEIKDYSFEEEFNSLIDQLKKEK